MTEQIGNGCGPKLPSFLSWLDPVYEPLRRFLFDWFHEASCNKHDEGYANGGDEVRRFECDWKFYQAMRRDSLREEGINRIFRLAQAIIFYRLVRSFGWMFFNYLEEEDELKAEDN